MKQSELTLKPDNHIEGVELSEARITTHVFPKHFHEDYKLGVVCSGEGTFFCRGTKNIVPQGHCFFIRPGEIHHGAGSWSYFNLNIHEKVVREVSPHQGTVTVSDAVTRDKKLVAAVVKIYQIFRYENSVLAKEQALYNFLKQFTTQTHDDTRRADSKHLAILCEHIRNHFNKAISSHDLARVLSLHPHYIFELFRKGLGISPHQYQNQIKINATKQALLTDKPIINIAFDLGFYDQSHLCRLFKRSIGVTPQMYRNLVLSKT
jgi:AraC-like DNA-binding protein